MTPAEKLKREQARAQREKLEAALWLQIRAALPLEATSCERQYRFHPQRRWAFDFAFQALSDRGVVPWVAVEVDGLTREPGRHQTIAGFTADCEKLNEAMCLGWRVLRVTGAQIKSGQAIEWLRRALEA